MRKLFVMYCVQCHGENGDGKGTTNLDRPARSFQSGGFSYGNTPEMLLRSITNGIPGTPMPSFAKALTDEQRKDLAAYVLLFAPQDTIRVTAKEAEMVVKDKPLIVRGKLPPIVDGAPERPRGLLIGTTDGLTFEYRTDDVRLLGVRQGGFCERKDWSDRGGTALLPLGKVVHVCQKGDPEPTYSMFSGRDAAPLEARMRDTAVRSGRAALSYELCSRSSANVAPVVVASIEEYPRFFSCSLGVGFLRALTITSRTKDPLQLGISRPRPAVRQGDLGLSPTHLYTIVVRDDGAVDLFVIRANVKHDGEVGQVGAPDGWNHMLTIPPTAQLEVDILEIPRANIDLKADPEHVDQRISQGLRS